MIDVTVCEGKYRYIFDADGARALRHGEPWRDCCGDNFILALAQDLEEARNERDDLRKLAYVGEHMHYDCSWKARFAEVKAERDQLRAELKTYTSSKPGWDRIHSDACNELHQITEERDALAAHVERCQKFLEDMHMMPVDWTIEESQRIHADKPETSLAKLKARVAAEALRNVAAEYNAKQSPAHFLVMHDLMKRADEIEKGVNHE